MNHKTLLGVALGAMLGFSQAHANVETFLDRGMTPRQAVEATLDLGSTPEQVLIQVIDNDARGQSPDILEVLLKMYPEKTGKLVHTAIQMNMDPALVVAIASSTQPDRVEAITKMAIKSGADPLDVVTNTTQQAPSKAKQIVDSALEADPDLNLESLVLAAIVGGADPNAITQATAAGIKVEK